MSEGEFDIQVDFSGGQINKSARKRTDVDVVRTGASTMENWYQTATGQLIQRPGRNTIYYTDAPRGDFIRVSTGEEFSVRFAPHKITICDLLGKIVSETEDAAKLIWDRDGISKINWTQAQDTLYICYPRMRPFLCVWDRSLRTWSFYQFSFDQGAGTIKMPFYRRAALGAAMSYNALSGTVTLTCSESYFTQSMVGTTLSIIGQQVILTKYVAPNKMEGTISYRLPESIGIGVDDTTPFLPGQIAESTTSKLRIEIASVDRVAKTVVGILLNDLTFDPDAYPSDNKDALVSPLGSSKMAKPTAAEPGSPTIQWQEQFFGANQGYPESVSFDRGRLIFTAFPQASNAILWSQLGAPNSFWIDSIAATSQPGAGAEPKSAMFELVSGSSDIFYVEGWQQGQFTFTRRGVYFTAASQGYPIQPGNITFDKISDDGVSTVRPVTIQDAILFINAGLNRICAIRPAGSATRPFIVQDISDVHTDLFKTPRHLTVKTGDGERPERVVYVINDDGSVVVGKAAFTEASLFIGWSPWTSRGLVKWVSAKGPNVFYTVQNLGAYGPYYDVQVESEKIYMDNVLLLNNSNGQATPPAGFGPFYKMKAGTVVTVMDGTFDYGDRKIDSKGFVIPYPGETFTSGTIVGGFFKPAVLEPFSYFAKSGDRTKRIGINRVTINVTGATDFFVGNKSFVCQKFGMDGTAKPVLLDGSFRIRKMGRGWEQTVPVSKQRPGPITICELTLEVSN